MHDQATYELIERYCQGECNPEEVALVDKRLSEEPEFAALLAFHRELDLTLADTGTLSFAKELAAAGEAYHAAQDQEAGQSVTLGGAGGVPRRSFAWQRWAAAASIALLAVVGGYFLLRDPRLSPPEAYDQYFAIYDAPANFRSDDDSVTRRYGLAFAAYNGKDWDGAITAFTALAAADSNQVTARFYAAVAMLADGQAVAAIPLFEKIAGSQSPFATQGKWYLALAWLKQGDIAAAQPILQSLADGAQGKFQQQAQDLLQKLGK